MGRLVSLSCVVQASARSSWRERIADLARSRGLRRGHRFDENRRRALTLDAVRIPMLMFALLGAVFNLVRLAGAAVRGRAARRGGKNNFTKQIRIGKKVQLAYRY